MALRAGRTWPPARVVPASNDRGWYHAVGQGATAPPLTLFGRRGYHADGAGDPVERMVVYRTWSDQEAQILKGLLESYGIPVLLDSDISHSLYPLTLDGLGETRVLVPGEARAEAESILAGHRARTGRLDA
jgi:Putative prokaryotic signal transducing protein